MVALLSLLLVPPPLGRMPSILSLVGPIPLPLPAPFLTSALAVPRAIPATHRSPRTFRGGGLLSSYPAVRTHLGLALHANFCG